MEILDVLTRSEDALPTNLRKSPRLPLVAPVQVSWTEAQGIESQRGGYSIDTSSGGLKMELPGPIPMNSCITVRLARLGFVGSASVRHCRRDGPRYIVGVAFRTSPSEVLRSEPALPDRARDDSPHDPAAESRFLIDEPVSDDVRLFFQDLNARKSRRAVSSKARYKTWLRVALVLWVAVGVLFILTLLRLLRYATETYQHPLLQKASAFVEAAVNYGHRRK